MKKVIASIFAAAAISSLTSVFAQQQSHGINCANSVLCRGNNVCVIVPASPYWNFYSGANSIHSWRMGILQSHI